MRPRTLVTVISVTAALAVTSTVADRVARTGGRPDRPAVSAPSSAVPGEQPAPGTAAALTAHLAQVPADWPGWSALGGLQLERGRATGDPAAYAAAQHAYDSSLRLHPDGNDTAMAGRAALADARHEFATGLRLAGQATAVNPDNPQAVAALTDALTELGRYDLALAAARRLDALRPGVASFSRLSYQAELRGQLPLAIDLMRRAAADAESPAQVAFARSHEGLLELGRGDLASARAALRAGAAVAPDDVSLTYLDARIAWAAGDRRRALARYTDLVARRPSPVYAAAQAEALAAAGDARGAAAALTLVRAAQRLAGTAGVVPEGADVLFEADHGDPARAVAMAAALWRRSPSVGAADAYAWALHRRGADRQALGYADRALALGGHPALMLAHRGLIRAALGPRPGARADLTLALRTDPGFSALLVPQARAALAGLGGSR